jgi:hypothetical protein
MKIIKLQKTLITQKPFINIRVPSKLFFIKILTCNPLKNMFLPLITNPTVILIELVQLDLVLDLLLADPVDPLFDGAVGHVLRVLRSNHQETQRVHETVVTFEVESVDRAVLLSGNKGR